MVPVVDVVAGPVVPGFELGELLARGATSEVWAAVARDGGRRVAVKVVHADLAALEVAAREAAVSARAASAHVVEVEACVELADGRVALVMPHLRGGALDALVRARGYLSAGEVVTVLAPLASALGRLHDLGVVHGDVSPGNVLLDLDGRPVLGDLGLGHVVGEVAPGVWGTDGYVAPEVLLGADPTPASDVYSLGALGWLCVSGTVPGPPGLRPELADVCRAGAGSEALVAALALAVSPEPADRPGAHELAWLLFGAAPAEPLHLVHGDDAVSAVTYRLRAAAGAAPEPSTEVGWWSRILLLRRAPVPRRATPGVARPAESGRLARPGEKRGRSRAGGRDRAVGRGRAVGLGLPGGHGVPGRHPRRGREGGEGRPDRPLRQLRQLRQTHLARHGRLAATGERARRWRTPAGAGVGSLALGLLIAALLVLTVGGTGRPTGAVQAGATGVAHPDPRTDPSAPWARPAELLQVLADERAAAWRRADPARLGAADAPGSPAAARDAAALAELVRARVRYSGLGHTVVEAAALPSAPTSGTPPPGPSLAGVRVVVRARIDAGAYTVVERPVAGDPTSVAPSSADKEVASRPAVVGVPVLVSLVLTEAGWRIDDVGAAQ